MRDELEQVLATRTSFRAWTSTARGCGAGAVRLGRKGPGWWTLPRALTYVCKDADDRSSLTWLPHRAPFYWKTGQGRDLRCASAS